MVDLNATPTQSVNHVHVTEATAERERLIQTLAIWYEPDARELAWRDHHEATIDPIWGVLVSEIMSQQTQAERAALAWTHFMEKWPTPAAMASAPVAEVIVAWQGLGYNRRGVNLHRCAVQIVAEHGGEVPRSLDGLLGLPGVGPYTARAVLVFGFGDIAAPVDTNVARVLARTQGVVLGAKAAQRLADDFAAAAVEIGDVGAPAQLSAALMDVGAKHCRSKAPRCDSCPLRKLCVWSQQRQSSPGVEDPAAKGAYRPGKQGKFKGSRREKRGQLLNAAREGMFELDGAVELVGNDAEQLLDGLVAEGLLARMGDMYGLPVG